MTPSLPKKLDALTSLRFFAAAMIVLHHSTDHFGLSHAVAGRFVLDQAVSFFFVLSGFILTYVYPTLDSWADRRRFWLARFARIWPAHLAAFVLLFLVLRKPANFPTRVSTLPLAVLNLALVHAWIPAQNFYFSYNAVSWTISTEMFFYLIFPLLIWKWSKTWWFKLPLTLGLAVATIIFVQHVPIPGEPVNFWHPSRDGLVYINPVARLFEFALGMTAALAFRRTFATVVLTAAAATLIEIAVLVLTIFCMDHTTDVTYPMAATWFPGQVGAIWAGHGPLLAPLFGLLIFTLAFGRGYLSRVLSHPLLILLGEISFTIYLLHLMLLMFYNLHQKSFDPYSQALAGGLFCIILLVLAWLVWAGFERPLRARILALAPRRDPDSLARQLSRAYADPPPRNRWSALLTPTRNAILAGMLVLALLLAPVTYALAFPPSQIANPAELAAIVNTTPREMRGIHFGRSLELLGYQLVSSEDGLVLKLACRAAAPSRKDYTFALHFLDQNHQILAMQNALEESSHFSQQSAWIDEVHISADKLQHTTTLGLALFVPNKAIEEIDKGPRDWENHRLLIPLP